jgi:hypothetical protein
MAHALLAPDVKLVVVALRGTPAFDRWHADLDLSWARARRQMHALGAQPNMGGPSGWSASSTTGCSTPTTRSATR